MADRRPPRRGFDSAEVEVDWLAGQYALAEAVVADESLEDARRGAALVRLLAIHAKLAELEQRWGGEPEPD